LKEDLAFGDASARVLDLLRLTQEVEGPGGGIAEPSTATRGTEEGVAIPGKTRVARLVLLLLDRLHVQRGEQAASTLLPPLGVVESEQINALPREDLRSGVLRQPRDLSVVEVCERVPVMLPELDRGGLFPRGWLGHRAVLEDEREQSQCAKNYS